MKPEQELTRALKMVIDAFTDLDFKDTHILGLVNLILNGHIDQDGQFTKEYEQYAKRALNLRREEPVTLITLVQG